MEEFKIVPSFPDYKVNKSGRVLGPGRFNQGKILKQQVTPDGYLWVTLTGNGRSRKGRVHRMVLEAFIGPCPKGMQAAHLDGNKTNNHLSNLAWVTPKENRRHMKLHGVCPMGSTHGCAKLTETQVLTIRNNFDNNAKELARIYSVSTATIHGIVKRKTWRHV